MDKTIAENYFSSLNNISQGILKQKVNFTSLLGAQWDSLPVDEQDALLDEHFVSLHVKQKYAQIDDGKNDLPDFYPTFKIKSGQRIVEDDEGEMWQDEHSGPFSWETSSQSEFSMDDDLTSTETVKIRARDPKRPKSPRLIRSGSGDQLATRPGNLERTGSTDFQQLRHIWEAHHCTTPDGEMAPSLQSYLSRSQNSLNMGELSNNFTKHLSNSVDSIAERDDETDATDNAATDNAATDNAATGNAPSTATTTTTATTASNSNVTKADFSKSPTSTLQKITHFGSEVTSGLQETIKPSQKTEHSAQTTATTQPAQTTATTQPAQTTATTQPAQTTAITQSSRSEATSLAVTLPKDYADFTDRVAPLATKEEDDDITRTMKDDVIKMSEIQTKMEENMSAQPITAQKHFEPFKPAKQKDEGDILAKFGVTFSYGPAETAKSDQKRDSPRSTADSSAGKTATDSDAADLPSGFDFLSAW